MYDILIHKRVGKSLKDTPKNILMRFALIVEALRINPVPWREFDVRKIRGSDDTYRIRIGDYRVIYFFEKENKRIHILRFEMRDKVYKR